MTTWSASKSGFKTAGKGVRIMVDANQAFNRVEALRRGRAYQQLGCFWYEEPIVPYDHEGYAELAAALDMRIACGENEYNKHAFMDLLLKKGADVVQPDNRRAGGPTEWMEIAAIADGFGVELASHGGGPVNMNILCAIPNAIYMESRREAEDGERRSAGARRAGMSSEPARRFHRETQECPDCLWKLLPSFLRRRPWKPSRAICDFILPPRSIRSN